MSFLYNDIRRIQSRLERTEEKYRSIMAEINETDEHKKPSDRREPTRGMNNHGSRQGSNHN